MTLAIVCVVCDRYAGSPGDIADFPPRPTNP